MTEYHDPRADTSNVVLLPGVNKDASLGTPDQRLVDMITEVLEMALRGELKSFVGAGFTHDNLRLEVWAPAFDNVFQQTGSLYWLTQKYVEQSAQENRVIVSHDPHPPT